MLQAQTKMPSISQIEEGLPVLTGFSVQTHKKNAENEIFQNGISNGIHNKNKHHEKVESENNMNLSQRNGHYPNGISNGNGYTNGSAIHDHVNGNGVHHDETDRVSLKH